MRVSRKLTNLPEIVEIEEAVKGFKKNSEGLNRDFELLFSITGETPKMTVQM